MDNWLLKAGNELYAQALLQQLTLAGKYVQVCTSQEQSLVHVAKSFTTPLRSRPKRQVLDTCCGWSSVTMGAALHAMDRFLTS